MNADGIVTAGTRELPPPAQRVVPIFEQLAAAAGAPLTEDQRILDFGAGAGRHVGEFREAGYETVGVDQAFTSLTEGASEEEFLYSVEPPDYRLPFGDSEFDFVYSTSVMEHVIDPGSALAEISRVLRDGGISIHVFPARWRPVEPHMYTPFGGRLFQNYWSMRLWAELGIRAPVQEGWSAERTALSNVQYCKVGISYPTAREWMMRARPHFPQVGWDEATFIRASRPVSGVSRLVAPLLGAPGVRTLYRGLHTRVLVLKK